MSKDFDLEQYRLPPDWRQRQRERDDHAAKEYWCTHERANSSAFLDSAPWQRLRMQVLINYGSRCMRCGWSPGSGSVNDLQAIYETYLCVDHIKPRRYRPDLALDFENLQVLCNKCNYHKGNDDWTDWRNGHER